MVVLVGVRVSTLQSSRSPDGIGLGLARRVHVIYDELRLSGRKHYVRLNPLDVIAIVLRIRVRGVAILFQFFDHVALVSWSRQVLDFNLR